MIIAGTHEIGGLALAPQGKRHWKMMPYKDTLSVACGWWCTPFTRTTLACHDQHVQRSLGMSSLLSLFHFARGQPWAKTVPAAASPPGARLPERYGLWPVLKHRKLCCVCWFSNKLLCILLYTALSIMQSPFEICPQYSLWTVTIQDEIHACFYRAKFSLHSLRCTRVPLHLSCRYTWTSNHHAIHHATLALIIPTSHITASIFLLCTHT